MPNCNFIDTRKKGSALPTPIFTILTNAEQLCVRTTLYSLYGVSTKTDDKGGKCRRKLFTVLSKVWLSLRRFREPYSRGTQVCGHIPNECYLHRIKIVKNAIEGSLRT